MQALLIDIEGWEIQMERLLKQIEAYKPCNEQEEKDRELLIQWIRSGRDIVTRANETAHLTASAWVVSPDRKHVLMAYHNIYNSWAWLGGHADGEWNLQKVAIREVEEESGLSQVTPLQAPVRKKPDENSAVAWIPVEQIAEKSTEPWFVEHIYSKLCKKALTLQ